MEFLHLKQKSGQLDSSNNLDYKNFKTKKIIVKKNIKDINLNKVKIKWRLKKWEKHFLDQPLCGTVLDLE